MIINIYKVSKTLLLRNFGTRKLCANTDFVAEQFQVKGCTRLISVTSYKGVTLHNMYIPTYLLALMCSVKESVSEVKTVRLLFHLHKEHANRACKIGVKSVKRSLDILFSIGFRNVFTLSMFLH